MQSSPSRSVRVHLFNAYEATLCIGMDMDTKRKTNWASIDLVSVLRWKIDAHAGKLNLINGIATCNLPLIVAKSFERIHLR